MHEAKSNDFWILAATSVIAALAFASTSQAISDFRAGDSPDCDDLATVATGKILPIDDPLSGGSTCYRFELTESGFLVVALPTARIESGDPRLRGWAQPGTQITDAGPSHLIFWARDGAGTAVVEILAGKGDHESTELILSSHFLAEADLVAMMESSAFNLPVKDSEDGEIDPILTKDSEDGEIDPILIPAPPTGNVAPFGLGAGLYVVLVEERHGDDQGPYSLIFSTLRW